MSKFKLLNPEQAAKRAMRNVEKFRWERARKAAEERRKPAAMDAQSPQNQAAQGNAGRGLAAPQVNPPETGSKNPFAGRAPLSEGLQRPEASRTKEELDRDLLCATGWSRRGDLGQLIKEGANVNARDGNGYTALIKAATDRRLEDAKLLVDAGADVDAGDENGHTALMESSSLGHTGLVVLLIKSSANVNAKDSMGRTALDFAKMWGRTDVAEILEGNGAKLGSELL